ncbi:Stage V sporulation protein AE1 (SpoVAE1) [Candidatus Syntrophocurvum alkaliphilum]|uniref:Stage V sporulation protein AE1 (SpoVAE1) n=1 Tax=Candidatus Syntrophocurvum alkaliphilum TaxID=2293317 RepID=A0A6I6DD09_9FIRM|nr:SpoVA/SpoVAEb family sporulation membrane protein [Candidatus Syntrophocurvum alkaliphilum]QGT99000.1 Stage V sporulation protein AE1 (SpoVAE1) [Candidatus Syntrophocurvum alkaliphilum]
MITILMAFVIGGLLCGLGQLIIDFTKHDITIVHVLVGYVIVGSILSGIGVYQHLVDIAGAGALIPISGFGHLLTQGAIQGSNNLGLIGAFSGGVEAVAAIITSAVVFGYMFAVLFDSRGD